MTASSDKLDLPVNSRIKFKGTGSGVVESLNYDARGVAHIDGKATFIEGALPGETVDFGITRKKSTFDNAVATHVEAISPDRIIKPKCSYFGKCGGCAMQHIRDEAQINYKQTIVGEQLKHIAGLEPDVWMPPITGPHWGYRRKARLGAKLVEKKGGVLVGFREKASAYVTNMNHCLILDERVSDLIPELKLLIAATSIADQIPQIEVAGADNTVALVFRHLKPLQVADEELFKSFADRYEIQVWTQSGGPETVRCLSEAEPEPLYYGFEHSDVKIQFQPADFTQINADINSKMVQQAIDWLDVSSDSNVLDLFCGLGNFSLPIAQHAGFITGIEGSQQLVDGATANARRNNIDNIEFLVADLYKELDNIPWNKRSYSRLLLDPPRTGALEILKLLPDDMVEKIVYVSCYPGTLARDAEHLVKERGYKMSRVGVMDMFPQTTHVETMALFERA